MSAAAILLLTLATGCPDDPYATSTWIKKLDSSNPKDVDDAVTQLDRFEDPAAIKPLAKTWEKYQRSTRVLRTIIKLAAQDECLQMGDDGKCTKAEGKFWEGGPYWTDAIPVLEKAVKELDIGDQRSIENATIAADALGEAKDPATIPVLVQAVNTNMPKVSAAQRVRLNAIRALGKFGNNDRAVETLIKVLEKDPKDQRIELFAAAALALGESRSEKAIVPLLEAMFKIGAIYPQVRRALVGIGDPAVPHLEKVFQGEHKEINALARKYKFNTNCWPNGKSGQAIIGPGTDCQHPTNLEFKSASLLGDLAAKRSVPMLLEGLAQPPLPAFFENNIPGPYQHYAILDALRKIQPEGDKAAAEVRKLYLAEGTDDALRPLAIDVYSFLTSDTTHLGELKERMGTDSDKWEDQIRMAAAIAYGRLANSEGHVGALKDVAKHYQNKADKLDKTAEAKGKDRKKAEEALRAAEEKVKDKSPEDQKKDAGLQKAKKAFNDAELAYKRAESDASFERSFQRAYEQGVARAAVGVECSSKPDKAKADCYVKMLDDEKALFDVLKKQIANFDKLSEDDKKALKTAAADRALLDLTKMGRKASGVTDALLKQVGSTERIIRQGVLMALTHTAELPCEKCVKRLDEIIARQGDESTLRALTVETETARNYFLWAGKK